MNLSHYGKTITYIAMTALTFLVTALTDDALSVEEVINLAVVVLGAIGVYAVPNFPEGVAKYLKTGIAFLTAAAVTALSFLTDGIVLTEWIQIIIAAFAAVGVYVIPNGPKDAVVQPVEVVAAPGLASGATTTNIIVADPNVDVADAIEQAENIKNEHLF